MRRAIICLLSLLCLAACSGGTDSPPLNQQLLKLGTGFLKKDKTTERPPLTRAVLDTLEGSFLEVTRERTNQSAFLFVSAVRRDGLGGEVVVWRTEDDVTLALRNDVLVQTRGLGGDLLSSAVRIENGVFGPAGSGERRHAIRALDNKAVTLNLACELSDTGRESIEIIGLRLATRHLRETCVGGGGTITNDYWVDLNGGLVWQSRQWVGPEVGYLFIRRLTTG